MRQKSNPVPRSTRRSCLSLLGHKRPIHIEPGFIAIVTSGNVRPFIQGHVSSMHVTGANLRWNGRAYPEPDIRIFRVEMEFPSRAQIVLILPQ